MGLPPAGDASPIRKVGVAEVFALLTLNLAGAREISCGQAIRRTAMTAAIPNATHQRQKSTNGWRSFRVTKKIKADDSPKGSLRLLAGLDRNVRRIARR